MKRNEKRMDKDENVRGEDINNFNNNVVESSIIRW